MKNLIPAVIAIFILAGCSESTGNVNTPQVPAIIKKNDSVATEEAAVADAATILSRKQVPILCYHHIRDIQMASKANKGYEVTVAQFKAQMKALADSGYQTITPDQLYNYLTKGTALPARPVMITYDDTSEEHFTIARAEMDKYGFKGVYFIMTISIGRPRYMSRDQIKQLSDEGHIIASHTWDHHRVDRYTDEDFDVQLAGSKKKLEEITGKPVEYFAYPFGIWDQKGIPQIDKRGYKMSFQLSTARDSTQPLHTVRRMIVSPEWSPQGMIKVMKSTFR